MGKSSRDKGNRVEREIINWHKDIGIPAERVPLSGASHYQGGGHDVDLYPWGKDEAPLVCEVKARADGAGSTLLRRWLGEFDALFLHEDRQDDLVVLPRRTWEELILAVRSTNTRRRAKNRHVGATSERRAEQPPARRKGEANEYLVES